ncbi:site-specific integrase [Nocardia sp. NBC_00881]|uniref:tyrosine-type recombinase/integrase n=1 Tax=Nocardia sp. NBC_00881 TaxID=2975995 RepID=UPI00386FE380|nr:site-specific integrase [Nocardia sp. NBC_00881]
MLNQIKRLCTELAEHHPAFRTVQFTPHDFRRLFATELVNNGLPIHIGAALLGHMNIQTTRGYVAVFDENIVHHYAAFSKNADGSGRPTSTGPSLTESGTNSMSTSTNARSNSGHADGPTGPAGSTNMRVSAARCCTSIPG